MKWIIILCLLILPKSINKKEQITISYKVEVEKRVPIVKKITFNQEIIQLANFIKKHEGKRLKTYICPGGIKTIGYGHSLTKLDKFDSITDFQADSLLYSDIKKAMNFVSQRLPYLKGSKKIAITHFVYAVGCGNLMESTLYKNLKDSVDITNSLLAWNKIKGRKSKELEKQRLWELKQFYNE